MVTVVTHPVCARHRPPAGHPERPERHAAVLAGLARHPQVEARLATDEELRVLHAPPYLTALEAEAPTEARPIPLDPDTWLSPASMDAARAGVGGALDAVARALAGEGPSFVATRPPGHHALAARPMGFCLFGTVALAAKAALDRHGAERVAILDFDVHHGNGTEALLEDDPRILFASIHQGDFWPGTGAADHEGPHGTVVNVPVPAGTGSAAWRRAVETRVLPRLTAHRPDLLLISAGFDADARDPLGGLRLGPADFAWATAAAMDAAGAPPVVSVLEGGYDLDALTEGAAAHVAALSGESP